MASTHQQHNVRAQHSKGIGGDGSDGDARLTQARRIRLHGLQIGDVEVDADEEFNHNGTAGGHHLQVGVCGRKERHDLH